MKANILISLMLFPIIGLTQEDEQLAFVSIPSKSILIWNVENFIEFQANQKVDSAWLYAKDCDFKGTSSYAGYLTPRSQKRNCTVAIMGLVGNDTIRGGAFPFDIIRMPAPAIRIGQILDVNRDFNHMSDSSLFYYRYFLPFYSSPIRLLTADNLRKIRITKWEVIVGDQIIKGHNSKMSDQLIDAVENAAINTKISFKTFHLLMPDGRETTVSPRSIYYKKTPASTYLPEYKPYIIDNK